MVAPRSFGSELSVDEADGQSRNIMSTCAMMDVMLSGVVCTIIASVVLACVFAGFEPYGSSCGSG